MSNPVQQVLSQLKTHASDDLWLDSPNLWTRQLDARALNELAVNIVMRLQGAVQVDETGLGFQLRRGASRLLVRICTQSRSGNRPYFVWRRIRPDQGFTHIAFVAIQPNDCRLFVVPLGEVPASALRPVKGSPEERQIFTSNLDDLPWLTSHELA